MRLTKSSHFLSHSQQVCWKIMKIIHILRHFNSNPNPNFHQEHVGGKSLEKLTIKDFHACIIVINHLITNHNKM